MLSVEVGAERRGRLQRVGVKESWGETGELGLQE